MEIRTITGTSISDALAEAKSLWGDSVVMLQAQPETSGGRARIAVCLPQVGAATASGVDLMLESAPQARQEPAFVPGAMRRAERATGAILNDRIRPATEVFARISAAEAGLPGSAPDMRSAAHPQARTESAEPVQLNPLFIRLIRQGMRPRRARDLAEISRSAGAGTAAAVTKLAADLPPKVEGRAPRVVAFTGAPGAGKTSLVVRAALSRVRAGRRAPHIVVVAPEKAVMKVWQDPTIMFESFDLTVVRCSAEALPSALSALDGDVLLDCPTGFKVPAGYGIHTRLVVDARSAAGATAREGDDADSVVVTHLDQAPALGYVTERLIAMQTPVAALVRGGQPGSGMEAYSTHRFAASVCND